MTDQEDNGRPSVMARRAVAEMIALQRRIFERQRKLIEDRETHQPSRGFARYRNEYRRAVSGYANEAGFGALCDAVARARVAYVSDYHTLRLAQHTFVKLVRGVMHQVDNLCLAMEFVDARHQQELNRYLEGRIKERTFLQRICYREHWPYDIWPNFKPIFDLAIEQGFPVLAIDNDSSFTLAERDRRAAKVIAKAAADYPDATILAFSGQMHVAPSHLPAAVDKAFIQRGIDAPERVIVYQNAEEIYWQLAREGREEVEVVRVNDESFCVNNTPPLVQQLSYLHWIQYDEELLEYSELETTVRSLIGNLGKFLGLKVGGAAEEVRVFMPGDLDLADTLAESGLEGDERDWVLAQVAAEESACIPALELIYLATLSVNHAAEEAAHYLKNLVAGNQLPDGPRDRFYYLVLHEACGFFGSKVINPKRKTDHQGKLRQIVARGRRRTGRALPEEQAASFALDHLAWQRGRASRRISPTVLKSRPVFGAAAHMLGYMLGDRLYYGLTDGVVAKKTIRELFLAPLSGEGEALERYLDLAEQVRKVKLPRRI